MKTSATTWKSGTNARRFSLLSDIAKLTSSRPRSTKAVLGRAETSPTPVMRLGSTCRMETSQSATTMTGTSACRSANATPTTRRLERAAASHHVVVDPSSDTPPLHIQRDRRHGDEESAAKDDPDRDGD